MDKKETGCPPKQDVEIFDSIEVEKKVTSSVQKRSIIFFLFLLLVIGGLVVGIVINNKTNRQEISRKQDNIDKLKVEIEGWQLYFDQMRTAVSDLNKGLYIASSGDIFWWEVHSKLDMSYQDAEDICQKHDSIVAQIKEENKEDYHSIAKLMKPLLHVDEANIYVWIGITIDLTTGVSMPEDAFTEFLRGFPKKDAKYDTHVLLVIPHQNAGMMNWNPRSNARGVLCQLQVISM